MLELGIRANRRVWAVVILILLAVSVEVSAQDQNKDRAPKITGMVEVTLHIFSGRRNPTWKLDDKQIEELNEKIRAMVPDDSVTKGLGLDDVLGYRGFSIRVKPKDGAKKDIVVYNNLLDFGEWGVNRKGSGLTLERWLIESGTAVLQEGVKKVMEQELKNLEQKTNKSSPEDKSAP